jgi:hypothetical protein
MMAFIALMFSVIAMVSGFYAAYLWHRASKEPGIPDFAKETRAQTLEPMRFLWDFVRVLYSNAENAAPLNQQAAMWTAITVALTGMASVVSSLQSFVS